MYNKYNTCIMYVTKAQFVLPNSLVVTAYAKYDELDNNKIQATRLKTISKMDDLTKWKVFLEII